MASVQFSSVPQSSLTLCDPMDCSTPGFPVHHELQEFTQAHVHWVSDATQPSHPLSSPYPPAFNLSQHQGLFEWVLPVRHIQNSILELFCRTKTPTKWKMLTTWWNILHSKEKVTVQYPWEPQIIGPPETISILNKCKPCEHPDPYEKPLPMTNPSLRLPTTPTSVWDP